MSRLMRGIRSEQGVEAALADVKGALDQPEDQEPRQEVRRPVQRSGETDDDLPTPSEAVSSGEIRRRARELRIKRHGPVTTSEKPRN